MKKKLTDKFVAALKPQAKPYVVHDTEMGRLKVRVMPSGAKSYNVVVNRKGSHAKWHSLGDTSLHAVEAARAAARTVVGRVSEGLPAVEVAPETFGRIAASWMQRHVLKEGEEHRTAKLNQQYLDRIILPAWRDRPINSIKRSDVSNLLDEVQDEIGAASANAVLTVIRSIMTFQVKRDEEFRSPIIAGMARYNVALKARQHALNDDEIRAFWTATDSDEPFLNVLRMALLTTARVAKVQTMKWTDISKDGVWTIDTAPREKPNAGRLTLPPLALAIIERMRARGIDSQYVFAGRRRYSKPIRGHVNGFDESKKLLDSTLPEGFRPWVIHDLRRTGRSLMARAGVPSDDAEMTLGHVLRGIVRTYNVHPYEAEKAAALRKLAGLIETIIDPRPNVVPLRDKKRAS